MEPQSYRKEYFRATKFGTRNSEYQQANSIGQAEVIHMYGSWRARLEFWFLTPFQGPPSRLLRFFQLGGLDAEATKKVEL